MTLAKKRSHSICIVCIIIFCSFLFANLAMAQYNVFTPFAPLVPPIFYSPLPFAPMIASPPVLPSPTVSPLAAAAPTASISALTGLLSTGLPSTPTGLPSSSTSTATSTVTINWSGLWISLLNPSQLGPMNLVLTQNTTTGAVTGTVTFILNKLVPLPTLVTGIATGTSSFTLTGVFTDYQLALSGLALIPIDYTITLTLTLTSPTTLSGTYSILSIKESDFGSVDLTAL
ncbi:MAG: hypothetical protein ACMUJM_14665 [bacterium]